MRFEERVQNLLKSYRGKTEDELIMICCRKVECSEEHAAAKLALAEIRRNESNKANSVQVTIKIIALISLGITALMFLFDIYQWFTVK